MSTERQDCLSNSRSKTIRDICLNMLVALGALLFAPQSLEVQASAQRERLSGQLIELGIPPGMKGALLREAYNDPVTTLEEREWR